MKTTVQTPTENHRVFAWKPVLVFDRTTGAAHHVWLEFVNRKLVSVQGVVVWSYSLIENSVNT